MLAAMLLALPAACVDPASAADRPAPAKGPYETSFVAGDRDPAGNLAGGTELRLLVAHGGRLYAGNGFWEDQPGPEGRQPPQVLVLDAPGGTWRVDHAFDDRLPGGRLRDLAVGALAEVRFETDGTGRALPRPVSVLLASTWDVSGTSRVFAREDGGGTWRATTLATDRPGADFLPQIRSFGTHRDRVTGADLVVAGQTPRGVFAGHADASGLVSWNAEPELDAGSVAIAPGLEGRLRVSSFAEANGRLYSAVGKQVYERVDGPAPRWRLVYTTPRPGRSETGLRGLTAVAAGGGRQVLLAAVEGSAARIVRVDPDTGAEATEVDLPAFLGRAWGMPAGYVIAAYNDMTPVVVPGRGEALLIGLMAFVPRTATVPPGHAVVDVGYAQVEAGAWFLVRWPDASYELHRVTAGFAHPPVAVRTIAASPFPGGGGTVYLGGFDANKAAAHDTAWIVAGRLDAMLRAGAE